MEHKEKSEKNKGMDNAESIIECPHCKTPIKLSKNHSSLLIGIILSLGIGYKINDWTSSAYRYPIKNEYALMNACINTDAYVSKNSFNLKMNKCAEAIEKTMVEVSFSEYKKDHKKFNNSFIKNFQ